MDEQGLGGLDDDLPPDTITLVASEEKPDKFELTLKAAKMSNLIKSIVDAGNFIFIFILYYIIN